MDTQGLSAALEASATVGSDYERANTLTALAPGFLTDEEPRRLYFLAATGMDSDHQRGRVLRHILQSDSASEETIRRALESVAKDIDSDFEKANVMIVLARWARGDEELRKLYMDTAGSIESSLNYERAVRPLGVDGRTRTGWCIEPVNIS